MRSHQMMTKYTLCCAVQTKVFLIESAIAERTWRFNSFQETITGQVHHTLCNTVQKNP